jgi:hypothetical protein
MHIAGVDTSTGEHISGYHLDASFDGALAQERAALKFRDENPGGSSVPPSAEHSKRRPRSLSKQRLPNGLNEKRTDGDTPSVLLLRLSDLGGGGHLHSRHQLITGG